MANKEEVIQPGKEVSTGAYSAGLKVGDFLFVSGQGPLDLKTGAILGDNVEEQTKKVLENVELVLKAAGCSRDDVVKSTVHLADINDFGAFNGVYSDFFNNPPQPARTTVQSGLPTNMLVEIDVIAKLPE